MREVVIKANQRVAYVGMTGSGKTYLAQHNLMMLPRLMVLDGKHTIPLKSWNLEEGSRVLRQLKMGQAGRMRIREVEPTDWLPWLNLALQLGNIVVYIDEMILVNPGSRPSLPLARLYQTGRELGIGVQAATQRPRNVPAVMFSEADWYFVFRLSRKEDRKAVADYGDQDETMLRPIQDTHGFYTYSPRWPTAVYTKAYHAYSPQKRDMETAKLVAGRR